MLESELPNDIKGIVIYNHNDPQNMEAELLPALERYPLQREAFTEKIFALMGMGLLDDAQLIQFESSTLNSRST